MSSARIGWRLAAMEDLPALCSWATTGPARQWLPGLTAEVFQARCRARIQGEEPVRMLIAQVRAQRRWRDVGYLQAHRMADSRWVLAGLAEGRSVVIDYVVAESEMGHGLATAMVASFLAGARPQLFPGAPEVLAAPDHRHAASLRVLAKNGFRQDLWVDEPAPGGGVASTVILCRRHADVT